MTQGGWKRAIADRSGSRRGLEFDGHLAGAGKDRIRNILVPVEHQAGEIGIGAGAQRSAPAGWRHPPAWARRTTGWRQVGHGAGEIRRRQIHHGAVAHRALMQLEGLVQGEAKGLAIGIGAHRADRAAHQLGHGVGIEGGLAVEGQGQNAAVAGGGDMAGGGEGEAEAAIRRPPSLNQSQEDLTRQAIDKLGAMPN